MLTMAIDEKLLNL